MNWLWMLVGAYLLYAVVMVVAHPSFLYPFGADRFDDPAFETQSISAREIQVAVAEGDSQPAVLFFMGNGGSLSYFTYSLQAHQDAGRTIAGMVYRGGGGAPGRPSEAVLKADALAAYDWLAAHHEGPVVVHGFSLGTGLALHVAARRPVAAVILDAPYASLCGLMTRASYLPACVMPGVQRWQVRDDARAVSAPVLIQHGREDQLIPPRESEGLVNFLQEGDVTVTRHLIEDATHNNLAGQPGYAGRINAFLEGIGSHDGTGDP